MDFASVFSQSHSIKPNQSYLLKRHIRIKSTRLPPNFFKPSSPFRYEATPLSRQSSNEYTNRSIKTPSFHLRNLATISREKARDFQRKAETARPSIGKNENEDTSICEACHQTRRASITIRKQSPHNNKLAAELFLQREFRLPKILNKGLKVKNEQTIY